MEVCVISKEHIKPSSPTPTPLKTYNLCLLDHLIPAPYAPILLFYAGGIDLFRLKQSLSETLTCFYPLAGKIGSEISINCDDGGALFVETRVNCSLSEFLSDPDIAALRELLPCELGPRESYVGTEVTNVQFNLFEDGGAAVGICISHRILDGAGLGSFFREWSAIARGENLEAVPNFSASSVFPGDSLWLRESLMGFWSSMFRTGKGVTKRFLFDSAGIVVLKDLAVASNIEKPSRVEVVSAFIWERLMAASRKLNGGKQRPSVLTHIVNLRKRTRPPMSDDSLGNIIWIAGARCRKDDPDISVGTLAGNLRRSIQAIDSHFINLLKDGDVETVANKLHEVTIRSTSEDDSVDRIGFSSWCNFGYYETDFGLGRPIWVSAVGMDAEVFMNLVILADTRDRKGVEAWITLAEAEMSLLEQDEEMVRFASLNPSPLKSINRSGRF
ncbi:hypothetical protein MLD38_001840 [Melastoma candidum]|uniref:Uncharacterized protein n=1 Tax=Melastoma candidum TaxID=119954 RepID=A0ACB9SEY0_9MYRT|nr:hypothetical protein MLD38_001840 [Melastoma candidum]